ncbi:MAG TPA: PKD domain-containing protein, partial [Rubricoccaceae bacterium]|nr:PKD domain-containing protein [Rubricoccaceae bacterium]
MPRSQLLLALLATLLAFAAPAAHAQTVRDSVRMSLSVFEYVRTTENGFNCGSGIVATWPDVAAQVLGRPGSYSDYSRVATEGMYVPAGWGETGTSPDHGIVVPDNHFGHIAHWGWGVGPGAPPASCAEGASERRSLLGGRWTVLNGSPYRITEWYAVFNVPNSHPIAVFGWEQGDGLAVAFDGSFESGLSHEVDVTAPQNRRPVSAYAWTFGDGQTGSGDRPNHTYAQEGEYLVRLTVTDDDGQQSTYEETVEVTAARLRVEVEAPDEAPVESEVEVVATITNVGTEPVYDVEARREFTFDTRIDEALNVEGSRQQSPELTPTALPAGETVVVTRPLLAPGESFEVRRTYLVEAPAEYRAPDSTNYDPVESRVEWDLFIVAGQDAGEEPVDVQRPCVGWGPGGGCADTTRIPLEAEAGLVVNSDQDLADEEAGDEECDTGEEVEVEGEMVPECTLRAAIEEANASGGRTITFEIPGGGPHTITPTTALPRITSPLALDATTQPGYSALPAVYLDGQGAGGGDGLRVGSSGVTIRGLAVFGFGGHGIVIEGGSGHRLEALVVGTDPAGTAGIGNGGDGIRVEGGAGITIGDEEAPAMEGRAGGGFEFDVAVAGNGGHGIHFYDPAFAAAVRARRIGEASSLQRNMTVGHLLVGIMPSALLPNGLSGLRAFGANGLTMNQTWIGPSGAHGLDVEASMNVLFRSGSIGKLRPLVTEPSHLAGTVNSALRIFESMNVTVGSDNASDDPVEAIASGGWMMEVEGSDGVEVRNVFGGVTQAPGDLPPDFLERMANQIGGLSIRNSPNVTVGAIGVPTVFANNNGPGVRVLGQLSDTFQLMATMLGAEPGGTPDLGNAGHGLEIGDGVPAFALGGDEEAARVVSGGNGGYGFFFRDLNEQTRPPNPEGSRSAPLSIGNHMYAGLLFNSLGFPQPAPNGLGGLCLLNSSDIQLDRLSVGATPGHGLHIAGAQSRRLSFPRLSVGKLFGQPLTGADQIFAPERDGVHIEGASDLTFGLPGGGPPTVEIVGTGGFGMSGLNVSLFRLFGADVGYARLGQGIGYDPAMLARLSNGFGGVRLENVEDIQLGDIGVANNGATNPAPGGGPGIQLVASRRAQMFDALAGIMRRFDSTMTSAVMAINAGPALVVEGTTDAEVQRAEMFGRLQAIVVQYNASVRSLASSIRQVGGAGGGSAIEVDGGRL